jgi:metal-responsive CopG/Arc/MetJ family transcriptional regulator
MKEKNVTVSLDERLLEEIDELVAQRVFRDRNEALRISVAEKLFHLRQSGADGEKEKSAWRGYLEDTFGGPSV